MTGDETASEVNFDGLVGPTHNYAGLSLGNRASMGNAGAVSSPRRAARQGLAKMRRLTELGLTQGVLPPQRRPDRDALVSLGFSPTASMAEVAARAPELVPLLLSASPMWAANAATVSPSADTADGRVHFTPANLSSTTHRSFESTQTFAALSAIFADRSRFAVHRPLPAAAAFADEGAANHGRLSAEHGRTGVELFVFGREADEPVIGPGGFPRRQTGLAGRLIARSHQLDDRAVVMARQSDAAIDAGAFHNDVVSVTNQTTLFTHEQAFDQPELVRQHVTEAAGRLADTQGRQRWPVRWVEVPTDRVPLSDAISSYLFNSQLVTVPDGSMALIAPGEAAETASVASYLADAVADAANPIASVHHLDLRESMRNGGGPACLRLRVVLTADERDAVAGRALVDDNLLDELESWVDRHYRDELTPDDLVDPALIEESDRALDELATLLGLPSPVG
jgi:succinylarginine dihydrolase